MSTMDGLSTPSVKLELESLLYYNYGLIQDIGTFDISAAGSGTFTQGLDYASLGTTPDDAVVRAKVPIQSATDIGVTVTGLDNTSVSMTFTATIKAYSPEGQAFELVPGTAGRKLKTIVSVVVSGGAAGDGFDIAALPDPANDIWIEFDHGFEASFGTEVKPIYSKFNLSHNKRIRGDRKLSISCSYTNNLKGLEKIRNRQITIIQRIKDDGRTNVTEVKYYDKSQIGTSTTMPSDDAGEAMSKSEGEFGRAFIFS